MISNDLIFPKFWSRCFDEKLEKHETYDAFIKDLKENRILEGLDMFTQEYEKDLQIDLYKWLCSVSQRLSTKYPKVRFCIVIYLNLLNSCTLRKLFVLSCKIFHFFQRLQWRMFTNCKMYILFCFES